MHEQAIVQRPRCPRQPYRSGIVQLHAVAALVFKPALVSLFSLFSRRSQVIEKFEALDIENAEHMETNVSAGAALSSETRQGRSEKRVFPRKRVSCGPRSRGGTHSPGCGV